MTSQQSKSPLLVVLAATGLQGTAVVNYFLTNEPSYRIRGTTRNPSSSAARALQQKGIEVVAADANDIASLKAAFTGASVIFAYSDFAGSMQSSHAQTLLNEGKAGTLAEAAGMNELQQGKNVANAASEVEGLHRLVWSALPGVKKRSGGKFAHAVHFDSKAAVLEYMLAKKGLEGRVSAVHMGTFMDNPLRIGFVFQFIKEGEGTYVYRTPANGSTVAPLIDAKQDTGAFVVALIKAPAGLQVLGESELMSAEDWLALWAKHNGVKARYERIPLGEVLTQDTSGMREAMIDVFGAIDEAGFTLGDKDILRPDEFEAKTGVKIPRTRVVDSIKKEDWSSVL